MLLLGHFLSLTECGLTLPNESITFQNTFIFTREVVVTCILSKHLFGKRDPSHV